MSTLFACVRAAHYASTILLFGEIVFALAVAGNAWAGRRAALAAGVNEPMHRLLRVARWSLAASIASGAAWLVLAAASMSGLPIADVGRDTLALVLAATTFGHAWLWRAGLAAALCALLFALSKSPRGRAAPWGMVALLAIAAAYLGALAWSGHAAAGEDFDGDVEIFADVVHLLAAGAWIGALPALVSLLRREQALAAIARATRRFSTLGAVCVALLAASGAANAWYLVGDVPPLVGTSYGRLLLAKLALFGAMLGLAIANRWYLAVRLAQGERDARHLIRRNAIAEIAIGIAIIAIVGALGVTPPAVHETPVWPFAYTLSFARAERSAWLQMGLAAAALMACVAAGAALAGLRRRRAGQWLASVAGIAVLAAIFVPFVAVPAYPTMYWQSPLRYTTDAIARGAALYASHCSECHGPDRLEDDPSGRRPPATATSVADHALRHREGEHFWWIAHGIPQTAMPGFAPRLSEADIWDLIEFLDAQVEAQDATAMTDRIKPLREIVAPDFAFEIAGRPQESLRDMRGKQMVLLVLYTLPQSLPRLRELAIDAAAYSAAGARVIALPLATSSSAAHSVSEELRNLVVSADASVPVVYAMFARRLHASGAEAEEIPSHVEFLIDRLGDLRVRWVGVAPAGTRRTAEVLDRIRILEREPARPPAWGHRHR